MEPRYCACNCGKELPQTYTKSRNYLKGHKPHFGGHHISKVQSNARKITLSASTTSVPLMRTFAEEKVKELKTQLGLWENALKAFNGLG